MTDILGPRDLPDGDGVHPSESDDVAARRTRHTRVMLANGAKALVDNANVEVRALAVDGSLWPLVLANPGTPNSDVCSPYTWYARYVPAELANRGSRLEALLARARGLPIEALLAALGAERVVYVNNWLLATNPSYGIPAAAIAGVTSRLVAEWPDRAVVFRSVNPTLDRAGFEALRSAGYRLVRSRHVYLVDTREESFTLHTNVKVDLQLLERTRYEIVDDPERLRPWTRRMLDLYRTIYVAKYVRHNPQFTERFFERTLTQRVFRYAGFFDGGRLDAIVAFFESGAALWSFLLGYDVTVDRKAGLYRLVVALLLREAQSRGLILNLSSGVGEFKTLRGGRAVDEFDAVYDAHLARHRRLPWRALQLASNRQLIDASLLA